MATKTSHEALLKLRNEDAVREAVVELRTESHPTNWLLFAYSEQPAGAAVGSPREVELVAKGTGGLDELRAALPGSAVRFALFEVVARQRARAGRIAAPDAGPATYDPSKYVFMTWLGPDTPAGLEKARSAGDAPQLAEILRSERMGVAIAGFVQYSALADVTYDDAARKVASVHTSYVAGGKTRAAGPEHAAPQRKISIEFDASCRSGLEDVHSGRARWALLGFTDAAASRGALRLVKTGTGSASEIAAAWRADAIQYAVVTVGIAALGMSSVKREEFKKTVVVSMVGEDVQPLARSRSAGQRGDVLDFVLKVMPLHVHYQPENASEITDKAIFAKVESSGK